MRTRRVPVNVARGIRLPSRPPARDVILTVEQVHSLAEAMPKDGDIVLAMAYLGLRWSELAALHLLEDFLGIGTRAVFPAWLLGRL